jgi:putative DNA primase/helicase
MTKLTEVPSTLKNIPNWVSWKLVKKDGEDSKVPFISGTTRHASSTDSSTWTTFETALANTSVSSTEGVGFVIHGQAIAEQVVGFDLDGCRNPHTGEITAWADAIINQLDSYTEITPSGLGLRVWVKGKLPGKDRVFNLSPNAGFGDKVKIEVFDKGRYFTVTGDSFFEEPGEVESRDLTEAYKLCSEFKKQFPANAAAETKTKPADSNPADKTAAQIKQAGAFSTSKLQLLMNGTIVSEKPLIVDDGAGNSIEYPSRSEADLALCTTLALEHGNKPELIAAEFAKSSLYREKWNRDSYQTPTINRAIATAEKIKSQQLELSNAPVTSAKQIEAANTGEITDEMLDREFPAYDGKEVGPMPMLIEGFLPKGANFFGSLSGVGKTWLGLSVTKALTSGRPLFGVFAVKEPVAVLYLIPEASDATFKRRAKRMNITKDKTLFRYRTISQGATLPLKDPLTVKMIQKLRDGGRRQVLIIVDTAVRFLQAEDENSSTQNSLVSDSDHLRSKNIGADLLFMHHSPKESKKVAELTLENVLRGTGDFGAMADVVYGIRRDESLFAYGEGPEELDVVCVKPRDLENPPLPFRVVLKRKANKDENDGRPVSVINETGDVLYVGPEEVKHKTGNLLDFTLNTEPYISYNKLTAVLKMRRELVKDLAERRRWRQVGEPVRGADGNPEISRNGKPKKRFRWTQELALSSQTAITEEGPELTVSLDEK